MVKKFKNKATLKLFSSSSHQQASLFLWNSVKMTHLLKKSPVRCHVQVTVYSAHGPTGPPAPTVVPVKTQKADRAAHASYWDYQGKVGRLFYANICHINPERFHFLFIQSFVR